MNLSKRSSIVSYVLEYFKKQYGIQVPLGEWERLHGSNGKNNVSQILVPSPRALKGIAIDINLYEKSRPSAHVPDKNARTASNIRSDSEGITQKIMNQFVFRHSLNGNCVGHEAVIQSPHPIMSGESLP
jgi:hypothetical protein